MSFFYRPFTENMQLIAVSEISEEVSLYRGHLSFSVRLRQPWLFEALMFPFDELSDYKVVPE